MASCFPDWMRYKSARFQLEKTQKKILHRILTKNKYSQFGVKYSFSSINSTKDYQQRVPLSTYDDYVDFIKSICNGGEAVLTEETVQLLEPTSGSISSNKLIPYTAALKKDFQRGISPWIFDLFIHQPKLMDGSAYWSLSPVPKATQSIENSCIPIGFESDTSYLSNHTKGFMKKIMAVPDQVKMITDISSFQYVTLLFLLTRSDLRLVSVWNPTFLSILLDCLSKWWDLLLNDLSNGKINPPGEIGYGLKNLLELELIQDKNRLQTLKQIDPSKIQSIWPNLSLVSCWADGNATLFSETLQKNYLSGILIQGKGLIATEGFMSFPLWGREGSALSINSHFFEFLPLDGVGETLLAHELEMDGQYEVVITTSGGLYRYQLQDQIQVVGFDKQVPMIRFIGKAESMSDLFGEKLSEGFVNGIVQGFLKVHHLDATFIMVAPEQDNGRYRYILFMDVVPSDTYKKRELESELDRRLRCNYHYDYCRSLGQLNKAKIRLVPTDAAKRVLEKDCKSGMKLGDIKPAILRSTTGWADILNGKNI